MHDSQTVTNEAINGKLDLLLRRMDQQDKRFDQMEKNLTEFKSETKQNFIEAKDDLTEFKTETRQNFIEAKDDRRELKSNLRADKEKLEKVYESRDQVTVKFSRAFAGVNILLAALVAFFVSSWR